MVDMADPTPAGYWHYLSHNFTSLKGFVEFKPFHQIIMTFELFPYVRINDPGVIGLTNQNIGAEANLTALYPIDEHLKLIAGTAYFKAGDALTEIATISNTPAIGQDILKSHLSLLWSF
jgi:hypothetical protein